MQLKVDYQKRNISWLLHEKLTQKEGRGVPRPGNAAQKMIIHEIIQAGKDKLLQLLKSRDLAMPPRQRGKCWKQVFANIASVEGTINEIVVKDQAIKILLPKIKDKSLWVEASEDVFEFIRN